VTTTAGAKSWTSTSADRKYAGPGEPGVPATSRNSISRVFVAPFVDVITNALSISFRANVVSWI
jgi:hypothetical protein